MNASAVTWTSLRPGRRARRAWPTPSSRCVLPRPTPAWMTSGLNDAPSDCAISTAAACARRLHGPVTKSSSRRGGRAGGARGDDDAGAGPRAAGAGLRQGLDVGAGAGRERDLDLRPCGRRARRARRRARSWARPRRRPGRSAGAAWPATASPAAIRLSAKWPWIHSRKKALGTPTSSASPVEAEPHPLAEPEPEPRVAQPLGHRRPQSRLDRPALSGHAPRPPSPSRGRPLVRLAGLEARGHDRRSVRQPGRYALGTAACQRVSAESGRRDCGRCRAGGRRSGPADLRAARSIRTSTSRSCTARRRSRSWRRRCSQTGSDAALAARPSARRPGR